MTSGLPRAQEYSFQLLAGNGFGEGHGGAAFGLRLDMPFHGLRLGFEADQIREFAPFLFGIDEVTPNENYQHFGGTLGGRVVGGNFQVEGGLGVGYLGGRRRTYLERIDEDCKGSDWFGGCADKDVVRVEVYHTVRFNTLSVDPYVEAGIQFSRNVGIGLRAEAFLNPEQGLGSIRGFLRFSG